jgi:hypothetical protein
MMGETLFLAAGFGASLFGSANFATPSGACVAVVDRAAVQAIERTSWIGQATTLGRPFAVRQGVLRAGVSLFGPQSAIFSVDVAIDSACNVLSTSIRLESNPWHDR